MYLHFWGARDSGEYIVKKGKPRPDWTYRGSRRNAARAARWPELYRWRVWLAAMREQVRERMRSLSSGRPATV